jgi:hypothetical protein
VRTYIATNLREINSAHNAASKQKHALYLSKLAILELCGWIELSMDDIIRMYSRRKLRDPNNILFVENEVIGRNFGFVYSRNFRSMLIRALGLADLERIERKIDATTRARLEAHLNALASVRNNLAHTYLRGITVTIDAPSATIARFNDVYDGLVEYERRIRQV